MATTTRQVASCFICTVACLLSIASFVTGSVLRYLAIYSEIAVLLIGLGADIAGITNFFKKFAGELDQSSTTQEYYYNCVLYSCILITIGQFGVGILFIIGGITEIAMSLITNAILMTALTVFIKRQNMSSGTEDILPPTAKEVPELVVTEDL